MRKRSTHGFELCTLVDVTDVFFCVKGEAEVLLCEYKDMKEVYVIMINYVSLI